MFTAYGLRVWFLKVCAPSVGLKPFSIWDGKSHSVIHFPGLGEEWLQHCWVGSLHHESWFIWDQVLATNSYKIKVLVTTDIRRSPLSSYPHRSPFVASCMIIKRVYCDTNIRNFVLQQRVGQGRPDNFLCVSYFHCSLGSLFFPPCPVCSREYFVACILGCSFPCLLINTPVWFVLFSPSNGSMDSLA